jgi:starvation-inducible DNA-binding protein
MEAWNGFRHVGAVEDDTRETGLVEQLQILLADVSVFYHTVHEFHWNVEGEDFYEFHKLFNKIVDDTYESIDPIAENIRKLGSKTKYKMSELLTITNIKEPKDISNTTKALTKELFALNSSVIETLKKTFTVANKENEQGVANFIAERIDMHQKWSWFLKSSIE